MAGYEILDEEATHLGLTGSYRSEDAAESEELHRSEVIRGTHEGLLLGFCA